MRFFPEISLPRGDDGLAGRTLPGLTINTGGDTGKAARNDAVAVRGEIAEHGGQRVWLPASEPAAAA